MRPLGSGKNLRLMVSEAPLGLAPFDTTVDKSISCNLVKYSSSFVVFAFLFHFLFVIVIVFVFVFF